MNGGKSVKRERNPRPPMFGKVYPWRVPIFWSGFALLSQAFALPGPVRDAASLAWPNGFHLHFPAAHLLFTPFCSTADFLTVLSAKQIEAFCIVLFIGIFVFLRLRTALISLMCFIGFVAWGALIPRPMAKLVADDPDILLVDFHSHTRFSHDGRPMFTAERNMAWHQAQGYEAAFITDHNRVEASQAAFAESIANWHAVGFRSLEGEEVSLAHTHLVILGNHDRIDNRPYDSDPSRIPRFISDMRKKGIPVIASLPEYWLYHWGSGVQDFANWGIQGFEIINSAPKALDFPAAYRSQVIELCRQQNLFMTGISDNHGYGYATAVWNAMRIPGWQSLGPVLLEKAVLRGLVEQRFKAVQVLERAKFWPAGPLELAISPILDVVTYWRSLQGVQALAWVGWIWLVWCLRRVGPLA